MSFMVRSARNLLIVRAARQIRKEIEKAGLDDLKILAEAGVSIVGTYLDGCSPQEKKRHKQEFIMLLQMGVTPDMLLDEIGKLMPEVGAIIVGKEGYRKAELEKIAEFLKGS